MSIRKVSFIKYISIICILLLIVSIIYNSTNIKNNYLNNYGGHSKYIEENYKFNKLNYSLITDGGDLNHFYIHIMYYYPTKTHNNLEEILSSTKINDADVISVNIVEYNEKFVYIEDYYPAVIELELTTNVLNSINNIELIFKDNSSLNLDIGEVSFIKEPIGNSTSGFIDYTYQTDSYLDFYNNYTYEIELINITQNKTFKLLDIVIDEDLFFVDKSDIILSPNETVTKDLKIKPKTNNNTDWYEFNGWLIFEDENKKIYKAPIGCRFSLMYIHDYNIPN